ncbi:hypothetical protein EON65_32435 [archaeon]|nr:MAG: hypothetical protein EON65_32435 [archaeon]
MEFQVWSVYVCVFFSCVSCQAILFIHTHYSSLQMGRGEQARICVSGGRCGQASGLLAHRCGCASHLRKHHHQEQGKMQTLLSYTNSATHTHTHSHTQVARMHLHKHTHTRLNSYRFLQVLRLRLLSEVQASSCKCQRSKTTGSLMVIMPKVDARDNEVTIRGDKRHRETVARDRGGAGDKGSTKGLSGKGEEGEGRVKYKEGKGMSLQEQLLLEAQTLSNISISEQLRNIVPRKVDVVEKGVDGVWVSDTEGGENLKWITELD